MWDQDAHEDAIRILVEEAKVITYCMCKRLTDRLRIGKLFALQYQSSYCTSTSSSSRSTLTTVTVGESLLADDEYIQGVAVR